jgi:CheY-like chemotaxis protein
MPQRHALVVDDDAEGRDALAQLLEAHGYSVRQAENGRVALDILVEWVPCLILLDLEMPVMTGWEVLDCLQQDCPHGVTVVVLSAATSPPPEVSFVRKPCDTLRLLKAIEASEELGKPARDQN